MVETPSIRIVGFLCNWCSYAGADLAGTSRTSYPSNIRIIRVPCSARVDPLFIVKAFERGADGVLVAGCHPGDCHYSEGNYHTRRRLALLRPYLDYLGIEKDRLRLEWVSASEGKRWAGIITDFTNQVAALGPRHPSFVHSERFSLHPEAARRPGEGSGGGLA